MQEKSNAAVGLYKIFSPEKFFPVYRNIFYVSQKKIVKPRDSC